MSLPSLCFRSLPRCLSVLIGRCRCEEPLGRISMPASRGSGTFGEPASCSASNFWIPPREPGAAPCQNEPPHPCSCENRDRGLVPPTRTQQNRVVTASCGNQVTNHLIICFFLFPAGHLMQRGNLGEGPHFEICCCYKMEI